MFYCNFFYNFVTIFCKERSVETGEQQSFLGNKKKDIDIPENQQTVGHENEEKTRTRKG